MQTFSIAEVTGRLRHHDGLYLEFLRAADLSMGLYMLPAGSVDPQQPHTEDEVYFVVAGQGFIHVAGENSEVSAGDIVYVPAGAEHSFHSIEEELTLLVFFAPAEHTRRPR